MSKNIILDWWRRATARLDSPHHLTLDLQKRESKHIKGRFRALRLSVGKSAIFKQTEHITSAKEEDDLILAKGPQTYSGPTCTREDAAKGRGFPSI